MERRLPLAGWLLFASILAALASCFLHFSPLPAGILQLAVAILLFGQVAPRVRLQSVILAAVGVVALFFARADSATLLAALIDNVPMIAMLAAVGMLRLVPIPSGSGPLPTGRRALWQTLFGVHWLGSVTNLSAVVLFGDRIADPSNTLERTQTLVLVRGFALAALWSPFFVAMGVALSQAPGAKLLPLFLWGLPLSELLMAILAWQLSRTDTSGFTGYPFNFASLGGPFLLAGSVLVAHILAPGISVVGLVTAAAPLYALFACRHLDPFGRTAAYIRRDLPRMGPEVLLFIAAGILGVGFTALVRHNGLSLPMPASAALSASLGLGIIVLLAAAGIHPIVGITAVGAFLGHIGLPPDLLALSFLMGWALGIIISPISGTNLLLAGRYRIPLGRVWHWHTAYVLCAYLLCCGWLWVVARFA